MAGQHKSAYISLLVLEVSNVQLTCRKPYAGNLLVMSNRDGADVIEVIEK